MNYLDFELRIGLGSGGEYPVEVTSSPTGYARGTLRLDPTDGDLQTALRRLETGNTDATLLVNLGERLFTALFTGDVRTRYAESIGRVSVGDGLRLRLRVDSSELQALPWKLLQLSGAHCDNREGVAAYNPVPPPTGSLVLCTDGKTINL